MKLGAKSAKWVRCGKDRTLLLNSIVKMQKWSMSHADAVEELEDPRAFLLAYCLRPFLSTSWSPQNAHNTFTLSASFHVKPDSSSIISRLNGHSADAFRPAGGGHHCAVIHVAKVSLSLLVLLLSIQRLYSFYTFPISCFGSCSVPYDLQQKRLHIS